VSCPLPPNTVIYARRIATHARFRLFRGHLVLDIDVPTMLLDQCPVKEGNEFTKMRYTAVTCDPNDFVVRLTVPHQLLLRWHEWPS
jgi:chitin synthase